MDMNPSMNELEEQAMSDARSHGAVSTGWILSLLTRAREIGYHEGATTNPRHVAAINTLRSLRYEFKGGSHWQPPLGDTREGRPGQRSIGHALDVLKVAMKADADLAWGWHCNLAMAFADGDKAGQDKRDNHNRGAANFMAALFNVNTWATYEKYEHQSRRITLGLCACEPGVCKGVAPGQGRQGSQAADGSGRCAARVPAKEYEEPRAVESVEAPLDPDNIRRIILESRGRILKDRLGDEFYQLDGDAIRLFVFKVAAHAASTTVYRSPEPTREAQPGDTERVWSCKIGCKVGELPPGCDGPLREAVRDAFVRLTGMEPQFNFTGWGGKLDTFEREVVDEVHPNRQAALRSNLRATASVSVSGGGVAKSVSPQTGAAPSSGSVWTVTNPHGASFVHPNPMRAMLNARRATPQSREEVERQTANLGAAVAEMREENEREQRKLRKLIMTAINRTGRVREQDTRVIASEMLRVLLEDTALPPSIQTWDYELAPALTDLMKRAWPMSVTFAPCRDSDEVTTHLKKIIACWNETLPF
jgi:hypothetical protein